MNHLKTALEVLRQHSLFAKKSKCISEVKEVEYLGHVISLQGVATDPSKIFVVRDWPTPATMKQLRGFLGLTGYYKRFVKGYGQISKPLTELLKKNAFHWSEVAQDAFEKLKIPMVTAPALALPDFSKVFVVEIDASC